jgi:hypothetical protein
MGECVGEMRSCWLEENAALVSATYQFAFIRKGISINLHVFVLILEYFKVIRSRILSVFRRSHWRREWKLFERSCD